MGPLVAATRTELREAIGKTRPGLVPTMGALHAGHRSLIARAARENASTVVSIFVNPAQFSDREDLLRYPRDLDRDIARAGDAGADIVFAPDTEDIYPSGFDTTVEVGALSAAWEGASRPGHLRGVATVVTILLNLVRPARAYFGEKDFQQLQVIRQLHRDLALPGEIVGNSTIREADGLALSSRNVQLSEDSRARARAIPRAIAAVQSAAAAGELDATRLRAAACAELSGPGVHIDYLAIVDEATLAPVSRLQPGARMLIAVEVGGVRLIDNAPVEISRVRTP